MGVDKKNPKQLLVETVSTNLLCRRTNKQFFCSVEEAVGIVNLSCQKIFISRRKFNAIYD